MGLTDLFLDLSTEVPDSVLNGETLLEQMFDGSGCEGVSEDVDNGAYSVEEPVHCEKERNLKSVHKPKEALTSLVGRPTVERMRRMETRPAGTDPSPIEAIVAVMLK